VQSDMCHFRAVTVSLLHLLVNWAVFTIYINLLFFILTEYDSLCDLHKLPEIGELQILLTLMISVLVIIGYYCK